jgi:hypothetical protein
MGPGGRNSFPRVPVSSSGPDMMFDRGLLVRFPQLFLRDLGPGTCWSIGWMPGQTNPRLVSKFSVVQVKGR